MYSDALALGRPSAITVRSAVAMVRSLARLNGERIASRASRQPLRGGLCPVLADEPALKTTNGLRELFQCRIPIRRQLTVARRAATRHRGVCVWHTATQTPRAPRPEAAAVCSP